MKTIQHVNPTSAYLEGMIWAATDVRISSDNASEWLIDAVSKYTKKLKEEGIGHSPFTSKEKKEWMLQHGDVLCGGGMRLTQPQEDNKKERVKEIWLCCGPSVQMSFSPGGGECIMTMIITGESVLFLVYIQSKYDHIVLSNAFQKTP